LAVTDWRLRRWRLWFLALLNAPDFVIENFDSHRVNNFVAAAEVEEDSAASRSGSD